MARLQTHPRSAPTEPPSLAFAPAEVAALLRAGMRLFERWGLSDAQSRVLLGAPAARTYARWKSGETARVPPDTARRLSYLMGIHKALRYLFKEPERAHAWIHKPNAAFGGQSALERMLAGDVVDLAAVRAYLDAERGAL
jgi:Antitoxin Xre/MbcA/ParS C-terminal toxin-binding domain/Antitoxin Xre-like helix-turn-helix domain